MTDRADFEPETEHEWSNMTHTLFRSPEDGELHATGPVDWVEDVVPAACQDVPDGDRDDLEVTRKHPTCDVCNRIGPKYEWSEDWEPRSQATAVPDGGST